MPPIVETKALVWQKEGRGLLDWITVDGEKSIKTMEEPAR